MTVYSTSMSQGPRGPYNPVVVFDGHTYVCSNQFAEEIEAKKHAQQILDILLARAKHFLVTTGFNP